MPKADNRSRLIELDALRGIAAVSVVFFHYTTHYANLYSHSVPLPFDFSIGRYGVELFFMISGYVIFLTLDKTVRPEEFIVSRFSRLYPAYWIAVFLTYSITSALTLPGWWSSFSDVLVNLSMIQQLFSVPHVDGVYWTLHRELGFYVLTGTLFYSAARKYIIPIISIIITTNILVVYFDQVDRIPGLWRIYAALPLAQLHLFTPGIALYLLRKGSFSDLQFLLMAALCLVNATVAINVVHASIIASLLAGVYLAVNVRPQILQHPYLLFLGAISYPLYLVHNNVGSALIHSLLGMGAQASAAVFCAVLASLTLATLINRFVEKPGTSWIRSRYRNRLPSLLSDREG